AHSFKAGITDRSGQLRERTFDLNPLSFRFENGVPNRLTQRALPIETAFDIHHDMGVFAQDRWTVHRVTLTYGGRYDYFLGGFPEQHVGPALLAPTRNVTFPENRRVASFHDISPRVGVAYDVFGTGK